MAESEHGNRQGVDERREPEPGADVEAARGQADRAERTETDELGEAHHAENDSEADVANESERGSESDGPAEGEFETESEVEEAATDPSAEDETAAGADTDTDSEAEPEPDAEPAERLDPAALIARYRLLGGPTGSVLPWSWSNLRPTEKEALVELIDGFVDSYNNVWALTDTDTVPPCWHQHPALAHDLSALAWAYYQAYRDRNGTPDLALRFQAHLPGFRERVEYWLGTDPAACRDGRHSRSWRQPTARAPRSPRDSTEERDAVILLGADQLGFPPEPGRSGPGD